MKFFFYFLRNLRYRKSFSILRKYCYGYVLDVGGWDFCLTAQKKKIPFKHWTVVESDPSHLPNINQECISILQMDGYSLDFDDDSFDTTLCV